MAIGKQLPGSIEHSAVIPSPSSVLLSCRACFICIYCVLLLLALLLPPREVALSSRPLFDSTAANQPERTVRLAFPFLRHAPQVVLFLVAGARAGWFFQWSH